MHNPDHTLPVISTSRLSWDAETQNFYTEASSLPKPRQIWSDSLDVGYTVKSHKTGARKLYYLRSVNRDADGDVCEFVYESDQSGAKIYVLND